MATNCVNCKQLLALPKRCSRCKSACYCSQECQKLDWKRHKPSCAPVSAPALKPAVKISKIYDSHKIYFHTEVEIVHLRDDEISQCELSSPFLKNGDDTYRYAVLGVKKMYDGNENNQVAAVLIDQMFVGGEAIFLASSDRHFPTMLSFIKKFCEDNKMRPKYIKLDMPEPTESTAH
jgi:hypothetical protein